MASGTGTSSRDPWGSGGDRGGLRREQEQVVWCKVVWDEPYRWIGAEHALRTLNVARPFVGSRSRWCDMVMPPSIGNSNRNRPRRRMQASLVEKPCLDVSLELRCAARGGRATAGPLSCLLALTPRGVDEVVSPSVKARGRGQRLRFNSLGAGGWGNRQSGSDLPSRPAEQCMSEYRIIELVLSSSLLRLLGDPLDARLLSRMHKALKAESEAYPGPGQGIKSRPLATAQTENKSPSRRRPSTASRARSAHPVGGWRLAPCLLTPLPYLPAPGRSVRRGISQAFLATPFPPTFSQPLRWYPPQIYRQGAGGRMGTRGFSQTFRAARWGERSRTDERDIHS